MFYKFLFSYVKSRSIGLVVGKCNNFILKKQIHMNTYKYVDISKVSRNI